MSKKNRYRAVSLQKIDTKGLLEGIDGGRIVLGIDVAKNEQFVAVMDADQHVHATVRWKQPAQNRDFVAWVQVLASSKSVEIVMEPSGTYGDALRSHLLAVGLAVFRVSPKRSHDAAEVYDGVPSLHDAKSAAIIAKLHCDGASNPWPLKSEHERSLRSRLQVLEIHNGQFQRNRGRLEALLARHFPEATEHLELGSVTLLELLSKYGSPQAIARQNDEARAFMRKTGRSSLSQQKIDALLEAARTTCGMLMQEEERLAVCIIATEARRNQKETAAAKKRVEELTQDDEVTARLGAVVGKTTGAVLIAAAGKPEHYDSAGAYVKSLGLNLKEKSSGKEKGGLHITKRGSGMARYYLFFAALRLLQTDRVVKAWYDKKVGRQGGKLRSKVVVAIMRKLVRALWHVAKGEPFDSEKLFDIRRLKLA